MSESDKSGKPELTAETKEQIFKWACEIEYENQNESTTDQLCLIAERATLHERSAAQARIAELEARVKELKQWEWKYAAAYPNGLPKGGGI